MIPDFNCHLEVWQDPKVEVDSSSVGSSPSMNQPTPIYECVSTDWAPTVYSEGDSAPALNTTGDQGHIQPDHEATTKFGPLLPRRAHLPSPTSFGSRSSSHTQSLTYLDPGYRSKRNLLRRSQQRTRLLEREFGSYMTSMNSRRNEELVIAEDERPSSLEEYKAHRLEIEVAKARGQVKKMESERAAKRRLDLGIPRPMCFNGLYRSLSGNVTHTAVLGCRTTTWVSHALPAESRTSPVCWPSSEEFKYEGFGRWATGRMTGCNMNNRQLPLMRLEGGLPHPDVGRKDPWRLQDVYWPPPFDRSDRHARPLTHEEVYGLAAEVVFSDEEVGALLGASLMAALDEPFYLME